MRVSDIITEHLGGFFGTDYQKRFFFSFLVLFVVRALE